MKNEYFLKLVSEICLENGIEIVTLDNDRICILSLNGKEKILWSKNFELNSITSSKIADNKSSTNEVLHQKRIPCVEYKRYNCHYKNGILIMDDKTIDDINNDLLKYHQIVLKPDNGYEGVDVYRVKTISDISHISSHFKSSYKYICSSPYYNVKNEYRTICLNGIALLSYKKILPFVVGNGVDNVTKLIYNKYSMNAIEFLDQMAEGTKEYIPKCNEIINVGWKFNLSQGSKSSKIEDENLLYFIQRLSLKASNAIHINFSSVDIIETFTGSFLIMEINSGVVLNNFIDHNPNNYNIAKEIYKQAILSMFDEKSNNI